MALVRYDEKQLGNARQFKMPKPFNSGLSIASSAVLGSLQKRESSLSVAITTTHVAQHGLDTDVGGGLAGAIRRRANDEACEVAAVVTLEDGFHAQGDAATCREKDTLVSNRGAVPPRGKALDREGEATTGCLDTPLDLYGADNTSQRLILLLVHARGEGQQSHVGT